MPAARQGLGRPIRLLVVVLAVALAAAGTTLLRDSRAWAAGLAVSVQGNTLVDGAGAPVRLIGVNYSGAEYACIQGWGIFDGPSDLASVRAMATWHVNAVRIPLNEDCWLGINGVSAAYSGAAYQQAVAGYVSLLTSQGMYAIPELHWSAPGTTQATGQNPMPDSSHTPAFWQSVASTFKGNPAVLFDLFNEPYPDNNQDTTAAWTCWKNGGTCQGVSYPVAGMQSLVDAVRGTGATNVIMAGGVNYANSLSQWLAYKPNDPAGQLVASAHIYGNNGCGAQNAGACLTSTVAPVAAQVPVIFGETGETYDDSECSSKNMQVILPWADAHNVSYLAWTWDTWGSCGSLISNVNGTVNTTTPAGAAAPKYVHDHFLAVAGAPAPVPSSSTSAPSPSASPTRPPSPPASPSPSASPRPTASSTPAPTPSASSTSSPTPRTHWWKRWGRR
jgi:endoglucanase